jgi:hypothetical protein
MRHIAPPVAASPDNWLNAVARLVPVSPNRPAKFGGSAPPLLNKPLIEVATFTWFWFRPFTDFPSAAVRFRNTSFAP